MYIKPKRLLNNSHIYVIPIPSNLFNFLNYHGLNYYLNKKDLHKQYSALCTTVNGFLDNYAYTQLNYENIDIDETNMLDTYIEYVVDNLEMIQSFSHDEVIKLVVIIQDLVEHVFKYMLMGDLYSKDYIIRDIEIDKVILEVSMSAHSGKQDIHYPS